MNGQDDDNQLLAAGYWEVMMPLDPHRFILLPGLNMVEEDPRKGVDHRAKLDGVGFAFVQAVYDAADGYIFHHPDHPLRDDLIAYLRQGATGAGRLATRWSIPFSAMT